MAPFVIGCCRKSDIFYPLLLCHSPMSKHGYVSKYKIEKWIVVSTRRALYGCGLFSAHVTRITRGADCIEKQGSNLKENWSNQIALIARACLSGCHPVKNAEGYGAVLYTTLQKMGTSLIDWQTYNWIVQNDVWRDIQTKACTDTKWQGHSGEVEFEKLSRKPTEGHSFFSFKRSPK